jgi:hypothetical protein
LAGTEVPLGPNDVRRALEFLQEAKLVKLKRRAGEFEVILKEDRFIRLPQSIAVPRAGLDIATKILGRWATNQAKKPIKKPRQPKKIGRRRGNRDQGTGWLFS